MNTPLHPLVAPAQAKVSRRRRKCAKLPEELRRAVIKFAARLGAEFAPLFVNRRLKRSVSRLLESQLPPRPRRPGRPGSPMVTAAIRMRDELRRAHPARPAKWIWRQIYRALIPKYDALPRIVRQAAEEHLRRQVRWRLYARRRAPRRNFRAEN